MTGVTRNCPPTDQLARFVLGQLAGADYDVVRTHLGECPRCADKFGDPGHPDAIPTKAVPALCQTSFDVPLVPLVPLAAPPRTPAPVGVATAPAVTPLPLPAAALRLQELAVTVAGPVSAPLVGGYAFLRPPAQPGDLGQLGPYRVLKELGRGGMGVVFQAVDSTLNRTVALKVLTPESAADERARARFVREARAVAALDHPNVVTVYQVGEDNRVPYIAMQFLRGESLEDRIDRERQVPVRDALRIAREVCQGLAAAHAAGLIHRDIKPANVWLEADGGGVKILDFGLARAADDQNLTRTGVVVGTPAFMSPEQATGKPLTHRSDLFSLGSMLYMMLTGRYPFASENEVGILMAIVKERPRAITELNPNCPELVVRAVWRLMSKHPDDRPTDATEAAELFSLLEAEYDPATQLARVAAEQQQAETKSRYGWVPAAGLAVLAAGLAFAAFHFWGDIQRAMTRTFPGQK